MTDHTGQFIFAIDYVQQMCQEMKEFNQTEHLHEYFTIFWVKKGEIIHATPLIEYTVTENNLFFIPPQFTHKMFVSSDCEGVSIHFNKNYFNLFPHPDDTILTSSLFLNPQFFTIINLENGVKSKIENLLDSMISEYKSENLYKNQILYNWLMVFLYEARRIHEVQYELLNQKPDSPSTLVLNFKNLIETNYLKYKDVSYYATQLNIRPAQLSEHIKKITGITPGEMIRNKILEETKKILIATDMNVKELAYKMGFDDPAYFSRFFKKYTDLTMTEYRDNFRKKYNITRN